MILAFFFFLDDFSALSEGTTPEVVLSYLAKRKEARKLRQFDAADALRDELADKHGVEVSTEKRAFQSVVGYVE